MSNVANNNYRFESQTVANKLGEIIDKSIGYKNKKQQIDKHFRGVIDSVGGTTANVSMFNSGIIPNVKIGPGIRNLFNGEEVYVTAIGGRLSNAIITKRVIDYDLLFEDEISDFLHISQFFRHGYNSWACTIPADAVVVLNSDYYKIYGESAQTDYQIQKTSYIFQRIDSWDLTRLSRAGSVSTDDDIIFFSFYMGSGVEYIDYVELKFFNSSNYYSFILQNESISSGWNRIKQAKSSFTNSGMSDWSAIDKIQIIIAYTQTVPLTSFVNFAYLGMASLYVPNAVYSLVSNNFLAIDSSTYLLGGTRTTTISETEPTTPSVGDLWLDTSA